MRYRVLLGSSAKKAYERAPSALREKIARAISSLEENPHIGKSLRGELRGCFTLRAWPFRIIYEIHKKELIVLVLSIKHRKDAYR